MSDTAGFFPGFKQLDIPIHGHNMHAVVGGSGPPLLLLHGYPQTHVMWHLVAPTLAEHFTVVAADLTGYGASGKPATDANHTPYSKRAMGNDMFALMQHFGFSSFSIVGHDRGGRVAHRMAVDHSANIEKLVVIDIAPTREMYANTTDAFARAYWHWFYLIQPAPFPENMILADTDAYLLHKCVDSLNTNVFTEAALQAYLQAFRDPQNVHASCEDYRAAATIDIEHDDNDDKNGRQISCPLLVLWGQDGVIESCFDALDLWRKRATQVQGKSLPGGHYLAEQHPELVLKELVQFLK